MRTILLLLLPFVSSLICPSCKDNLGREDCDFHTCKTGEFCEIKEGHHSLPEGTCHHLDKLNQHCPTGVCHDDHSSYCYCCTTSDCVRNVTDKHVSTKQVSSLVCPSCKDALRFDDCHNQTCNNGAFCEIKEGHHSLPEGTCHHLEKLNENCRNGFCFDKNSPYCYCCTTSDCVRNVTDKHVSPKQVSVMNDHGFSCYQCMGATSLDQCRTVRCHSIENCVLRINGDTKLQSGCEQHGACKHQNCHRHNEFHGVHCEHCCHEEHCVQTTLQEILPKLTTTCPICSKVTDPSQCLQNMQQCGGLNEKYCKLTTNGHHFSSQCVTSTDCTSRLPKFGVGCEENGVDVDCVHCCNDHKCFQLAFANYMVTASTEAVTTTATTTTRIQTTPKPNGSCTDTPNVPCDQSACADPSFANFFCRWTCGHCAPALVGRDIKQTHLHRDLPTSSVYKQYLQ